MKIRVFITGGTFDKEYNELSGTLFFRKFFSFQSLLFFFTLLLGTFSCSKLFFSRFLLDQF